MNILQLIDDLIRDEGEQLKPYQDTVGKWTIGVGRNLTDRGISKEESRLFLQHDIDDHIKALDHFLPWWKNLDDVRQRALANMCFNLGIAGLLGFKNMLTALQAGEWNEAGNQAKNSRWYNQVGKRAERIVFMIKTGIDPSA